MNEVLLVATAWVVAGTLLALALGRVMCEPASPTAAAVEIGDEHVADTEVERATRAT